jgi:single-stranded DNA-binding protein
MSASLSASGRLGRFHVTYAFGRTADYAASLSKGAHLRIVGEIQTCAIFLLSRD